ncbi:hypothetical protein [Fodinicola feengrottensis]|uniref:hypothetical protein n=1 Tax=Fodinicola feengrottensis TaxID=435914 RepID=UPI0013D02AA9|nr:hypothetical protein [Fodinicola feengrottensis]
MFPAGPFRRRFPAGAGDGVGRPLDELRDVEPLGIRGARPHRRGGKKLWSSGASPLGAPLLASYEDTFSRPAWVDWLIIGGMAVVFLVSCWLILTLKAARRGGRPVR